MKKDMAYAIELPYWQAPNDDIVLKSKGDSLTAFFKIWNSSAKYSVFTGIFDFSYVWAMRYERNKNLSYYIPREDDDFRACYWIVKDSSWLEKLKIERSSFFPEWDKYDIGEYYHYIIQSDSFYVEIIAKDLKISRKKLTGIF
ncbi:hypothetical protein A9G09_02880 [Gilliamella sp. wkB292]|uniref:hypothetical protein n=1 Tax=Gilliamella sp. wkB292 TaxID=3120262 RepID=UPI00080DF473|nr:hypothetical protein [Gilliamella apicola]OCG16561.1 hypothetical protein A9G09_02880 [Gilliamella apicola]